MARGPVDVNDDAASLGDSAHILPAMEEALDGVALVTGGSRGIGANVACELAAAGMRVAVGARTRADVDAVARDIGGLGLELDVARRDSVEAAVHAVEAQLGPISLLVNNAGIQYPDAPPWAHDPDEWRAVHEVNVLGPYLTCRAVGELMAERGGGRIVNVTSGMAWMPVDWDDPSTAYGSSKAALHRFSELLALQVRRFGIAVFSLDPGLNRTAMTADMPDDSPWTAPDRAPRTVRSLASGRYDELSGRFLHAEDDLDELLARRHELVSDDLRAVRLRV
jgi:3-oxoacyl-[acyl-carrier protein] reductase